MIDPEAAIALAQEEMQIKSYKRVSKETVQMLIMCIKTMQHRINELEASQNRSEDGNATASERR